MAPNVSPLYIKFFLTIEPITALAGFIAAAFFPGQYLSLTDASSHLQGTPIALSTSIVLKQLSNLYLLFALNEALVLRSSDDLRVWKTLLFGLLVADLGHLWSVGGLGPDVYWKVWEWNPMDFGNVGIVYAGAGLRIAFLCGVGVAGDEAGLAKKR